MKRLLLLALLLPLAAQATGWHHVKPPMVVKPPVIVSPPPVAAPVAVPAPTVAPAATTPAAQPAPPQQGGGGTSWLAKGGWALIGVGIYFTAAVYSHWIWCAEDDKKPAEDRKCYRPTRDGMP